MCTSALALPMPKMSIDTLIAAAEYIEQNDRKRLTSPQQPPPPPPPQPQPAQQQAPLTGVLLQQVLQQAPPQPPAPLQLQPQPQAIPIQHVTIQPHQTNGRIITTATAQPVNTIRIQKKELATVVPTVNRLPVMNSFDLINPAVIDQGSGEVKRKQPPMAFRTGTREVHNKLEKDRRAHLKDCFDALNTIIPSLRDAGKKTSNLNILDSALRCIKGLQDEDASVRQELEKLSSRNQQLQQEYTSLRNDVKSMHNVDVPDLLALDAASGGRKRRHAEDKPKVAISPHHAGAPTTPVTPAPASVAPATTATVLGSVLKLPKSITAAATAGTKDVSVSEGGAAAFAFTSYPIPAANGGLVLLPKALGAGDHHQLTAQFVSAHHHHHLPAAPADAKVIVNAQYVVKPLVVVSTASRPS